MVFLEEPPAPAAHPTRAGWAALAAQVRARGGSWCNISEEVATLAPSGEMGHSYAFYLSVAAGLEAGAFPGFDPAGSFEARADELGRVWARAAGTAARRAP